LIGIGILNDLFCIIIIEWNSYVCMTMYSWGSQSCGFWERVINQTSNSECGLGAY